jgi:hypothetical protein
MRVALASLVLVVWAVVVWAGGPVPPELVGGVVLAVTWLVASEFRPAPGAVTPSTDLRLAYRSSDVPSLGELGRLERMRAPVLPPDDGV